MIVYNFATANTENQPVLRKGGIVLAPGLELQMRGPIIPCRRGFHGSIRAIDALRYASGAWLNMREFPDNAVEHEGDKHVSPSMRILSVRNVTNLLHEFACQEAERALMAAGVTDARSWAAVAAKRAWLKGAIDDNELDAAWAAAWAAARAAAKAAAWDVAKAAAWAAARDAACDAAWAATKDVACDAAWAATWAAAKNAAVEAARAATWAAAWAAARAAAWDVAWAAARAASNTRLEALLDVV